MTGGMRDEITKDSYVSDGAAISPKVMVCPPFNHYEILPAILG